ncbi:MAG: hypothetical protein RDV41_10765 [Planctomycetota bacterium]|nr:hypothetical protein [Planctomycetota bacterium]
MRKILILMLPLLAAGFVYAAATPGYTVTDRAKVYYGNPDHFTKPAVLVANAVFECIPEYQEIKKKGLTSKDPEYWLLLDKANKKFYAALRKVADREGHDLVMEIGTIQAEEGYSLPNITGTVIAALEQ